MQLSTRGSGAGERRNDEGRPQAALVRCLETSVGMNVGWDKARPPALAGARGGFRRAVHTA